MKIMAVCGNGIGSSFMMEMNIKKVLKKLNVEAEVGHTDLASVTADDADIFVMGKDIASSATSLPAERIIIVTNLISPVEFEEKLTAYFNR
ncbi:MULTISPECIES: PTS sugar transporter subunit IIB [Actinobacillus]|uniref:PTS sugar transporter subunit IIB n=1 Tax=Actinobacillus TaxID=713 RepID=UPI002441D843|nr:MULTISPECIES: PTS sugar transporter subunit IIB [Actinobacillus]WGE31653.1 PTS sugar transporter subunit IIB [Actinobacillus genomosp. 2]WGE89096.1 PTS sugar transporter subunit IIB [Actinobacillus arthritidis]